MMMILACEYVRVCNMACSSRKKGGEEEKKTKRMLEIVQLQSCLSPTGICLSEGEKKDERDEEKKILCSFFFLLFLRFSRRIIMIKKKPTLITSIDIY